LSMPILGRINPMPRFGSIENAITGVVEAWGVHRVLPPLAVLAGSFRGEFVLLTGGKSRNRRRMR